MSKILSPLATFQSLGTRDSHLFTDAAKGRTFESALKSIDKLLNTPDQARSIQHLVKTIFDRAGACPNFCVNGFEISSGRVALRTG